MPQASKKERQLQRLKRQNTLFRQRDAALLEAASLRQMLQAAQAESYAVRVALYSILAHHNYEFTITIETMNQVLNNMKNLSIEQVEHKEDKGSLIIRLVEQEEPAAVGVADSPVDA